MAAAHGGEGEGLLVAFGVGQVHGQGVCDPAGSAQGLDDALHEVVRLVLVSVREDEVDVAAFGFSTAVAAHNDAFEVFVRDALPVLVHGGGDGLDFGARDLELEFVIVFYPDLLDAAQGVPALLDYIVKVTPAFVVVEFAGCDGADAPDFEERAQASEGWVGVDVEHGLELASRVVFVEEMGDFGVAAWESEDFTAALQMVRVGC